MSGQTLIVRVDLAARSYDVVVGSDLLSCEQENLASWLRGRRAVVVTDENVFRLHGAMLVQSLRRIGADASIITVAPGEESKSFRVLERLTDDMLALELSRSDIVIAFGGGVVGDLAGFAAAIYKRGIDFIQIPTTLLAQVDSSVGGKTAIDTARGKNLLGAFHQPRLVLADVNFLSTLDDRQMRAGYAEILKYGLLGNAPFFGWLEQNGARVLARETAALIDAVGQSVSIKAEIVGQDEQEQGRRALLNLGHTFGHALEAATGYGGDVLHGEAVALGCAMAFRYSQALGLCAPDAAARAEKAIAAAGLPVRLGEVAGGPFSAAALAGFMEQDKKAAGGRLTLILARAIGEAFVAKNIERQAVVDFLIREGVAS